MASPIAVLPRFEVRDESAPSSSKAFTTSMCPAPAARCSGVLSSRSAALRSAFLPINIFTIVTWPAPQVTANTEAPSIEVALGFSHRVASPRCRPASAEAGKPPLSGRLRMTGGVPKSRRVSSNEDRRHSQEAWKRRVRVLSSTPAEEASSHPASRS
eukprot:scaffold11_cov257-Pinguiococcus_pyrenoidosus.AAC.36